MNPKAAVINLVLISLIIVGLLVCFFGERQHFLELQDGVVLRTMASLTLSAW